MDSTFLSEGSEPVSLRSDSMWHVWRYWDMIRRREQLRLLDQIWLMPRAYSAYRFGFLDLCISLLFFLFALCRSGSTSAWAERGKCYHVTVQNQLHSLEHCWNLFIFIFCKVVRRRACLWWQDLLRGILSISTKSRWRHEGKANHEVVWKLWHDRFRFLGLIHRWALTESDIMAPCATSFTMCGMTQVLVIDPSRSTVPVMQAASLTFWPVVYLWFQSVSIALWDSEVSFLETSGGTGCTAASMAEHKWWRSEWRPSEFHCISLFLETSWDSNGSTGTILDYMKNIEKSCSKSPKTSRFSAASMRRDCVLSPSDGCQKPQGKDSPEQKTFMLTYSWFGGVSSKSYLL